MKKHMTILSVVAILFMMISGCKKEPEYKTLLVAGSTEMLHFTKALITALGKKKKNLLLSYDGGGSTPGMIAFKRKAIDVAAVSRPLTDDEDDLYTKSFLVAKGSIAIIVHPDNPIENMTTDDVYEIFSGDLKNWK